MKAYKILHTTSSLVFDGYGMNESVKTKEFYHFGMDEAKKHIEWYIEKCYKQGLKFTLKEPNHWIGDFKGTYYEIKISEIDIKP